MVPEAFMVKKANIPKHLRYDDNCCGTPAFGPDWIRWTKKTKERYDMNDKKDIDVDEFISLLRSLNTFDGTPLTHQFHEPRIALLDDDSVIR